MANAHLFEYSLRRKSVICWSVSLFSNSCDKGQETVVEVVHLRARGEVQASHRTFLVPLEAVFLLQMEKINRTSYSNLSILRHCLFIGILGDIRRVVNRNNVPIYIQQDATLHSLFYLETVLHVSGGTITHYQERK